MAMVRLDVVGKGLPLVLAIIPAELLVEPLLAEKVSLLVEMTLLLLGMTSFCP